MIEVLLLYLQRFGFDGAPRFLGIDDAGRQVLSFVHGEVAGRPWPDWVADDQRILSVARLVRRYDDAAHGFGLSPAPAGVGEPGPVGMPASTMGPATFVGHMDICPENVVFRDGQAWALIDFDLARPTNRLREVCNMLLWWAPLMPAQDREASVCGVDVFARAAIMVSAYDLAQADRALDRFGDSEQHRADVAFHAASGWSPGRSLAATVGPGPGRTPHPTSAVA